MTRITQAILAEAILELEHLGVQAQLTLADEVHARQPCLQGAGRSGIAVPGGQGVAVG